MTKKQNPSVPICDLTRKELIALNQKHMAHALKLSFLLDDLRQELAFYQERICHRGRYRVGRGPWREFEVELFAQPKCRSRVR